VKPDQALEVFGKVTVLASEGGYEVAHGGDSFLLKIVVLALPNIPCCSIQYHNTS